MHDVEWSGTLFYTTEGQFGNSEFKIRGEYIYLQDIGTAAYTEYEFGEDMVNFMMNNPSLLNMERGHIHSHNKMGVFFSSTDNSELHDNSVHYNYYLSLIVNNKNEMTAKIAFRAKRTAQVSVEFRGSNGQVVNRDFPTPETTEVVYIMGCEITKPAEATLGEGFTERYNSIVAEKEARELEARNRSKAYGGYNINQAWENGKHDNNYGNTGYNPGGYNPGGYGSGYKNPYGGNGHNGAYKQLPQGDLFDGDDTIRTSKIGFDKEPKTYGGKKSVASGKELYEFVVKLISQDHITEAPISSVLKKLHDEHANDTPAAWDRFKQRILDTAVEYYSSCFPEDPDLEGFNAVMTQATTVLDMYDDEYPELVAELSEAFNIEISYDNNKSNSSQSTTGQGNTTSTHNGPGSSNKQYNDYSDWD